ncbi:MAG: hypothetical protein FWC77_06730 [Defluviitaleaceae bacterium]|nr:hypothetical protein [Defluviitaleaceae bacterium]
MLTNKIKEKAVQLGYSGCGIIPAEIFEEYNKSLDERAKSFPESKEFYESQAGRAVPPANSKSIIVCVRGYNHYKIPPKLEKHIGKYYLFHGGIPYSQAFAAKAEFEAFLQVSGIGILKSQPPPVRWAAAKAGLGKFGRNNFIFTNQHGSHTHIDTWVVDTALEYGNPAADYLMPGCKAGCRKCIQACPTKALNGDFSMDRSKCITHLMYEKKPLPSELRAQMGQWLYGCDVCQDVCPMNKGKLTNTEDFPLLSQYEEHIEPEKILLMDDDTYTNIVYPRFWFAGKDATLTWQCNALRCMINSGDARYRKLIQECSNHPEPRIRGIARWGCENTVE